MAAPKLARDRAAVLVAEIQAYCAAHADPQKATKYARYFTEGYDSWGILDKEDPFFNERQAEWQDKYDSLGLRGFMHAGVLLFASGKYEEGSIAIRFVKAMRDQFDASTFPLLGQWFEGVRNWAHSDVLCGEIIGPLLQEGRIPLDALASWRSSEHKFQRRAVPVAMLSLLKAAANIPASLNFIRPLMTDGERVVHQGAGWFLREAWKKDRKPVEAFLLEWKDQAPRLIYQYATEKMTAAEKARFRASRRSVR